MAGSWWDGSTGATGGPNGSPVYDQRKPVSYTDWMNFVSTSLDQLPISDDQYDAMFKQAHKMYMGALFGPQDMPQQTTRMANLHHPFGPADGALLNMKEGGVRK